MACSLQDSIPGKFSVVPRLAAAGRDCNLWCQEPRTASCAILGRLFGKGRFLLDLPRGLHLMLFRQRSCGFQDGNRRSLHYARSSPNEHAPIFSRGVAHAFSPRTWSWVDFGRPLRDWYAVHSPLNLPLASRLLEMTKERAAVLREVPDWRLERIICLACSLQDSIPGNSRSSPKLAAARRDCNLWCQRTQDCVLRYSRSSLRERPFFLDLPRGLHLMPFDSAVAGPRTGTADLSTALRFGRDDKGEGGWYCGKSRNGG